jgi:hypothetical protein
MAAGRVRGGLIPLVVLAASLVAIPTSANAATWNVQKLGFQPRFKGDTQIGPLNGVSCPTRSQCTVVGSYGRIAFSGSPAAGAGAWSTGFVPSGSDNESEVEAPPPPPDFPLPPPFRPHLKGVSCPSPSLCVAVSSNGDVFTSTNPLGGNGAWKRTDIDGDEYETHLEAVSCPSVSFCVAVSGGKPSKFGPRTSGKVLTTRDPTGGSAAWAVTQLDPLYDLRGVSCSTPSLCVAVGQFGEVLVSTDPTGGTSAWRDAGEPGGPGHFQAVTCLPGLCIAGNDGGNLLTNTDPAGSPARWRERSGGGSVPITGISCPSVSQCVAVDNNGSVTVSRNPTGGRGEWARTNLLPYVPTTALEMPWNGMFGVSCPSASLCAIAAAEGTVVTSTDPFAGQGTAGKKRRKRRHPKRPRTIIAKVDNWKFRTGKHRVRVRFRFFARSKVRGFRCRLDRRSWRRCGSPRHYWVTKGRHAFRVRAIGPTGLRGPVASRHFKIHPPPKRVPRPLH